MINTSAYIFPTQEEPDLSHSRALVHHLLKSKDADVIAVETLQERHFKLQMEAHFPWR